MSNHRENDYAALVDAFRAVQHIKRSDWQGFCPLRHSLGCEGTDGRISAVGTPKPQPHADNCPFRLLEHAHPGEALVAEVHALRAKDASLMELLGPIVNWVEGQGWRNPSTLSEKRALRVGPTLPTEVWATLRRVFRGMP